MLYLKSLKFSIVFGHITECFNNMLYGFLAVVLAPKFFGGLSSSGGLLASYSVFAFGFLARPVGALVFGFIGDRYGRKSPLLWSIVLMGIPTLGIGCVPLPEHIGILSPILLLIFLLFQGFFFGGEFTGISLYISETSSKESVGRKTGIILTSGILGTLLAPFMGAVSAVNQMPEWTWRVPFILGGLASIGFYFTKNTISETVDFLEAKKNKQIIISPWKETLKYYKSKALISLFLAGLNIMPLYFATIFANRLFKENGFSVSQGLLLNVFAMLLNGFCIIPFGILGDKIGFRRQTLLATLLIGVFSIIGFAIISSNPQSLLNTIGFLGCLIIPQAMINGCTMPYIGKFFPTKCRYTAVALSTTIGHAIFGGTAPVIASMLMDSTKSYFAPALWLTFVSFLAFFFIILIDKEKEKRREQIVEEPILPLAHAKVS